MTIDIQSINKQSASYKYPDPPDERSKGQERDNDTLYWHLSEKQAYTVYDKILAKQLGRKKPYEERISIEIGIGEGRTMAYYIDAFGTCYCVEPDPDRLKLAQEANLHRSNVFFINAAACVLPHIKSSQVEPAFEWIRDYLVPNGLTFITAPRSSKYLPTTLLPILKGYRRQIGDDIHSIPSFVYQFLCYSCYLNRFYILRILSFISSGSNIIETVLEHICYLAFEIDSISVMLSSLLRLYKSLCLEI